MIENERADEPKRPVATKWYVNHAAELTIVLWVVAMGLLLVLMD
jgi:hypothetical protein